jgi:predicted small metal-binding protein
MSRDSDRVKVTFEVEVSEALVELIRRKHGEGVDIEDYIAGAVEMRIREELWNENATLTAEVPDELAEQAELLAEHSRVQHGLSGTRGNRVDWLNDISNVEFQFPDETEE